MARERLKALGLVGDELPSEPAPEIDAHRVNAINDRYFGSGRPRPTKPPRRGRVVFVHVDDALDEEIKRLADIDGTTISQFVRRALRNAIEV